MFLLVRDLCQLCPMKFKVVLEAVGGSDALQTIVICTCMSFMKVNKKIRKNFRESTHRAVTNKFVLV